MVTRRSQTARVAKKGSAHKIQTRIYLVKHGGKRYIKIQKGSRVVYVRKNPKSKKVEFGLSPKVNMGSEEATATFNEVMKRRKKVMTDLLSKI